jgi:hypothetical protein
MKFELTFVLDINGTQFNKEVTANYGKGEYEDCLLDSMGDISEDLLLEENYNSDVKSMKLIKVKKCDKGDNHDGN